MKKLEIEYKFLIKMPDENMLSALEGVRILKLSQTYTTLGARARRIEENGNVTYIKTVKKHITDLVRLETENEITKAEFDSLLEHREGNTVEKTRYIYPYKDKKIEIDVFPFWKNQAFLEVELENENEEFELPEFIEVIRDITEDKAYRNYALSKKIPKE